MGQAVLNGRPTVVESVRLYGIILYNSPILTFSVAVAVDVYTGETAKLFYRRSDRDNSPNYRNSRAWRNNITFSIIHKGESTGTCTNDSHDLEQFCLTKIEFKFHNDTHLELMIKNVTLNDSGDYTVEHVFGGLTNNEKIMKRLQIVEG